MTYSDDPIALLFELGLGPWLTPLRGKVPILTGWQSLDPVDEPTVRGWFAAGHNLGLRTGERSGLVVIDDDQCKHNASGYTAPPTGLVARSPTGSTHHYYRAPSGACPRNSASKIAPYVDVRGEGGQVVVPPSIHPVERADYRWQSLGEPAPWPVFQVDMSALANAANVAKYAQTALVREAVQVRTAPQGTKHDTLNRAAFNLGQLMAGGELTESEVRAELLSAAAIAGFVEREANRTISDGIKAGAKSPRTAPPPKPSIRARSSTATAAEPDGRDVLVPGSHLREGGEYVEQGNHTFADQVLGLLPRGAIYRRAGCIGTVGDSRFLAVSESAMRCIVDMHCRLIATKVTKDEEGETQYHVLYRTCAKDHASVILAAAEHSPNVSELVEIVRAPVLLPNGRVLDRAGYDASSGVLLAPLVGAVSSPPPCATIDDAREAMAQLLDPFREFPFAAHDDWASLLAYMLALAARPAIDGPLPGLLVTAPDFGAGKGLLARAATLAVTADEPKLCTWPSGRDAETEVRKSIFGALREAHRSAIIDNVPDGSTLRSSTLAALLTATEWTDRILGKSETSTVPARTAWSVTGVNVALYADLARRFVRVRLEPRVENASARKFEIPDMLQYVRSRQASLVAYALAILRAFQSAGAPQHGGAPLGSFESWDRLIRSCVVWVSGYDPCAGVLAARFDTPEHSGLAGLLAAWSDCFPEGATAGEAARRAGTSDDLKGAFEALGLVDDRGDTNTRRLGIRLREWEGRTISGLLFQRGGERHSAVVWRAVSA